MLAIPQISIQKFPSHFPHPKKSTSFSGKTACHAMFQRRPRRQQRPTDLQLRPLQQRRMARPLGEANPSPKVAGEAVAAFEKSWSRGRHFWVPKMVTCVNV